MAVADEAASTSSSTGAERLPRVVPPLMQDGEVANNQGSLTPTAPTSRAGVTATALTRIAVSSLHGSESWYSIRQEFWIPEMNARADLAVVSPTTMSGFELKAGTDRLARLPRQIEAYDRIFSHCYLIVDSKHLSQSEELIPDHWGLASCVSSPDGVLAEWVRPASFNNRRDPESLVRLLWKEEAANVLSECGERNPAAMSRFAMWEAIVEMVDLDTLAEIVYDKIYARSTDIPKFSAKYVSRV